MSVHIMLLLILCAVKAILVWRLWTATYGVKKLSIFMLWDTSWKQQGKWDRSLPPTACENRNRKRTQKEMCNDEVLLSAGKF
jgi:hypothetical protein